MGVFFSGKGRGGNLARTVRCLCVSRGAILTSGNG